MEVWNCAFAVPGLYPGTTLKGFTLLRNIIVEVKIRG